MKRIRLITLIGMLTPAMAAWGEHPRYDQMAHVKNLAHQLEEATHHVHKTAERSAHHRGRSERAALRSLHRFAQRARHFHRQAERYTRNPYHTEADFRRLVDAFYQARSGIRYLHTFDHVREDFHRAEDSMDELVDYYGGYGSYRHGGYDDHHHGYDRRSVPRWRLEFRWP